MIGLYFSGTGNTRYCINYFINSCASTAAKNPTEDSYATAAYSIEDSNAATAYSIEDSNAMPAIRSSDSIIFGYPVYYSNIPKFVKDYINENAGLWRNKRIYIIATMGLFSGDGAGILARLLKKHGAVITGGLHVRMPDCIGDEKVLKKTLEDNKNIVRAAESKLAAAALQYKSNKPTKEGLGPLYHMAGLFGQRLYFYNKTSSYSDKLKIDTDKCSGCGKCASICPMNNISINNNKAVPAKRCTTCYRCVNSCPRQAITLLGHKLYEQSLVEKYTK